MSELSFDVVKTGAIAYCEADDVQEKLGAVDLDQRTIDVVVAMERQYRIGEYTTAIFTALDTHRERLVHERSAIDAQIDQVDMLLGQSIPADAEESDTKPELTAELIQKLAIGVVDRETFIDSAMVYGVTQNVAARTFSRFGRYGASNQTVDLDQLLIDLMQDNNREGYHPLLSRQGIGPAILDASFAVTDAYLTAPNTQSPL